jgi:hypothetical protein
MQMLQRATGDTGLQRGCCVLKSVANTSCTLPALSCSLSSEVAACCGFAHPVTVSKGERRTRILPHLSCQAARIPARLPPMTTRGLGCSWVAHWLRAGEAVHMHASLQALVCACERAYAGQTTTGRREHRERSRHSESCRPSSLVRISLMPHGGLGNVVLECASVLSGTPHTPFRPILPSAPEDASLPPHWHHSQRSSIDVGVMLT